MSLLWDICNQYGPWPDAVDLAYEHDHHCLPQNPFILTEIEMYILFYLVSLLWAPEHTD